MSLLVLLVLLLLSFALVFLGKRAWALFCLGAALAVLLGVGSGRAQAWFLPLPSTTTQLQAPAWQAKNVIVVLGGGSSKWGDSELRSTPTLAFTRVGEAARLYFACRKAGKGCKVITSGGVAPQPGNSEAEVMGRELRELGVASADIVTETKSGNTFQNAMFTKPLLEAEKPGAIFLVTSGLHMRRALMYFRHFGIEPLPAPADFVKEKPSNSPLSYNFMLFDQVMHELLGIFQFHVYNRLGWNAR